MKVNLLLSTIALWKFCDANVGYVNIAGLFIIRAVC